MTGGMFVNQCYARQTSFHPYSSVNKPKLYESSQKSKVFLGYCAYALPEVLFLSFCYHNLKVSGVGSHSK